MPREDQTIVKLMEEENHLHASCPDCQTEELEVVIFEEGIQLTCPNCQEVLDVLNDKRIKEILQKERLENAN